MTIKILISTGAQDIKLSQKRAVTTLLRLVLMVECVKMFYATLTKGVPHAETYPELSGWSFMKIWYALQLRSFFLVPETISLDK